MTPNNGIAMQTYSGNTLRLVGLDTCITRSPQEVVARAGEWIQNPALIGALRERTRSNLLSSPFMDHETRVRELESCFREMWRRFLHNEPVTDLSVR
jgi:predicted O-linked N-acetylglucosamine transferase (SPINDLY family)